MSGFWRHRFRRTTLWLVWFLTVLTGIGLARTGPGFGLAATSCLVPFLILALPKRRLSTLILVALFGVSLGWWRGSVFMTRLNEWQPLQMQKITISARAMNDALYNKYQSLSFDANKVTLENGQVLTGKIQLSGFGVNAVFQGDEIMATGKLYPGYGPYQGRMSFAILHVRAHHSTLVGKLRQRFTAGMQTALPEPLAPFSMGLLVGQRATLPDDIKQDLLMVGLTHIIAVSGYNLTIILQASRKLLGKRSKRISTGLTFALIGVFLLLAGASASIVRAAIVSTLSILAAYYGRTFKPLNLIALAAVITAWINPVYIWSDLSWYLSFLAFYGVLVLSPLIQARWSGRWHESLIASVALESICAEIMSLPFVLYIFGQMSLISLPANMLVVTLVPLAMLLGVIAGLAGMLCAPLAGWFAWPAAQLLNYMLDTAHLMAHLPHIFKEGIGLSLRQMIVLYGCIIFLTTILWYKNPDKNAIITDINETKVRGLLA